MQTLARMVCSSLTFMIWPCLVKFKWRWWRHIINFICNYLHNNGFGLSLNLGASNMSTWHDHQSNYKNLNNVKVKQRFRRRSSVGEFDTRKVQQQLETSHIAYDNMLGDDFEERWLKRTWNKTWKEQMINISKCTEDEMRQAGKDRLILVEVVTPCPHELHKTSWGHHHCNPCRKIPQNHI